MNRLSLVILTYNRKAKLLRQLHSIYAQPEAKNVNIEIVDNHSDYDVREAIKEEFGQEVASNINIYVNPLNIGMCANLAMPFLHCKTDWMWTLSDDDETMPGSIAMLLKDIDDFPDTAVFKYNTNGAGKEYANTEVTSLPEFIDFCEQNDMAGGWVIFLSNNVYNMKKALNFYGQTLSNCYSAIAHILPMLNILDSKAGIVRIRNAQPIHFSQPEPGHSNYPYLYTAVGVSSIAGYKYNLTYKYYKKLSFLVTKGFAHYNLCLNALEMSDRKQGRFLYETVYRNSFKNSGHFIDKLYHCFYIFCYYTHFKVDRNAALKIRERIQKLCPNFR